MLGKLYPEAELQQMAIGSISTKGASGGNLKQHSRLDFVGGVDKRLYISPRIIII